MIDRPIPSAHKAKALSGNALGKSSRVCGSVFLLILALALGAPSLATATPASDFSFFGPGSTSLDFNEITMTQSTVITNQYDALGVTFSPNVWFENHRANIGWDNHNIANFLTGTATVNTAIEMVFAGTMTGVALEWAANGGSQFSFEAVSSGVVVEQFTHSQTGCCTAIVLGFENVEFDTLRITHQSGSNFFVADRLTWQPVPEPSAALLIGLGLTLLSSRARRP